MLGKVLLALAPLSAVVVVLCAGVLASMFVGSYDSSDRVVGVVIGVVALAWAGVVVVGGRFLFTGKETVALWMLGAHVVVDVAAVVVGLIAIEAAARP